ncbi:hypothetical protein [Clostridium sp. HBUAS56010]|uniref:hypothetical protein n=1 Tax=Clostridium sp. HBUAS56010 TaxID=2571127 RepID=UPI00163DB238|nr:hypothetical protein [Clostridium sp. HBUAS56010]
MNDEFLKALACFGCEYKEECLDDWESGHEQCDSMLDNAKEFAKDCGSWTDNKNE